MRKFALLVPLALLSLSACGSFTWEPHSAGLSRDAHALGVEDVRTLAAQYSNERKWRDVRRTMDGRTNALARDLGGFWSSIDRYLFNYSANDPYVNFETDENYYTTTLYSLGSGVGTNVMPFLPGR